MTGNPLPSENVHGEYMSAPRRKTSMGAAISFVLIVVAVIFIMSVSFRVDTITVTGNEHYTAQDIINAIEIEQGDNLFFFDRFAAVTRVFAKLPYISEVSIERALPNKVNISVIESSAVAYLKIGAELWTMDEKCKILGKAAEGEEGTLIPIVGFNSGTLFINETVTTPDNDTRAVSYLKEVLYQIVERNLAYQITKIDFSNTNGVKVYYGGKYTILLGDPYATEHKFSLVMSAISQLKEGDIGIIDVTNGSSIKFSPF